MTESADAGIQPLRGFVFPLLLFATLAAAYWPVFQKLIRSWESGDNSYGYLVIPLFLYLCREKRRSFHFFHFSWSLAGIGVCLLATFILLAGEAGSVETLVFFGIWGGIAGIFVALYGRRFLKLLFPFLILLFIVPLPPFINQSLTFKLKLLATKLSAVLLRASGVSVFMDGNVLDLGLAQLQVVDACSGLRYVMPMLLMALLIGHFFLVSRWRQALIVALALPLTIVVNAVRIWVTGLLAVNGLGGFAEGGAHDSLGLMIFLASGALLLGMARLVREPFPPLTHNFLACRRGATGEGCAAPGGKPGDLRHFYRRRLGVVAPAG